MSKLLSDAEVTARVFAHVDSKTTDRGTETWREPVESYTSQERFDAEVKLMRRLPVPFCPSAALPEPGSYITRTAALTPLLAVRGRDGEVRVFRNACKHRGMAVAEGEGCTKAFVCPYHAWSYALDGSLKHIPGEDGFPDLDKSEHSLAQVKAEEIGGVVYVTQDEPLAGGDDLGDLVKGALSDMPIRLESDQIVFDRIDMTDAANWKLIGETSMEGYHIKALHTKSFYPYGYDNLNVVELFGANSRIVFPFRRLEKLRDKPQEDWKIQGRVTDVQQIFPNTHISVLSSHSLFIILEPVSPGETRWEIFRLSNTGASAEENMEEAKKDASFVVNTGLGEDREAARSIHANIAAGANTHFTFGQFESAIVHFHKTLAKLLPLVN